MSNVNKSLEKIRGVLYSKPRNWFILAEILRENNFHPIPWAYIFDHLSPKEQKKFFIKGLVVSFIQQLYNKFSLSKNPLPNTRQVFSIDLIKNEQYSCLCQDKVEAIFKRNRNFYFSGVGQGSPFPETKGVIGKILISLTTIDTIFQPFIGLLCFQESDVTFLKYYTHNKNMLISEIESPNKFAKIRNDFLEILSELFSLFEGRFSCEKT